MDNSKTATTRRHLIQNKVAAKFVSPELGTQANTTQEDKKNLLMQKGDNKSSDISQPKISGVHDQCLPTLFLINLQAFPE